MAAKTNTATEDDAIQLYLAGEPLKEIETHTGVSSTLLHRIRQRRGVPLRERVVIDEPLIVREYLAGASCLGLARAHSISRGTVERVLKQAGVTTRSMSDAGYIKNARTTPEQRRAQAAAAHEAVRGRRVPASQKWRDALRREAAGEAGSEGERTLRGWLHDEGISATPQRAIGPYNVDLALPPIAVEVLGGAFHSTKTVHAQRTPEILDAGWHLVMVWNYKGVSPLGRGAADYLVAFAHEVRRQPPATCQYRVIAGDGQLLAAGGREDDHFPVVPPPRGPARSRT